MPKPIAVLAVTNTYPTASDPGDTPAIRDQLEALEQLNVQVDLLVIQRSSKWNYLRAAIVLAGLNFTKKRYDVIHAFYGHSGLLARFQFQSPIVVTFRGSDLLARKDGIIGRLLARWVDGVIVMTDEMKRISRRKDARIIPFGINDRVFQYRPMQEARFELGLPASQRLVLFPWNPARAVKRFELAEEAVRLLQREHPSAGLITVHDKPPEVVAAYMNACDALVLTSRHEGAPMAVREALACRLPVVSVDVGDVGLLIRNAPGCQLCRHNAADIAEKLGQAFRHGRLPASARSGGPIHASRAAHDVLGVYRRVLNGVRTKRIGMWSCGNRQ